LADVDEICFIVSWINFHEASNVYHYFVKLKTRVFWKLQCKRQILLLSCISGC